MNVMDITKVTYKNYFFCCSFSIGGEYLVVKKC